MLIRQDCMRRRQVINIPEFYAGSILQKVRENKRMNSFCYVGLKL